MVVRILTQEVDPGDLAKVFECLATIGCQVLDCLELELKDVTLPTGQHSISIKDLTTKRKKLRSNQYLQRP